MLSYPEPAIYSGNVAIAKLHYDISILQLSAYLRQKKQPARGIHCSFSLIHMQFSATTSPGYSHLHKAV